MLAADRHSDESDFQVGARLDRWETEVEYGAEAVEGMPIPPVGSTQPVRDAFLALDLVSPGISEPALRLYLATSPLGTLAAAWPDPERDNDRRWAVEWHEARDKWNDARHDFVDAVRADLGVNPETSFG